MGDREEDRETTVLQWNSEEKEEIHGVLEELDHYPGPRRSVATSASLVFNSSDIPALLNRLRRPAVLPIRHLLRVMGFDETRAVTLRLEHKLVQALVLNHYCPGDVPTTNGLRRWFREHGRSWAMHSLEGGLQDNAIAKPTIGFGSHQETLRSSTATQALESLNTSCNNFSQLEITQEDFILQERIHLAKEYRVHTIEDHVISGLTFRRYGTPADSAGGIVGPEEYVRAILAKLPNGFIYQSFLAWDIAETPEKTYCIIEVNVAGLHMHREPYFHCSGYFWDPFWGPAMMARALLFVQEAYETTISLKDCTDTNNDEVRRAYQSTADWLEVLDSSARITKVVTKYDTKKRDRFVRSYASLPPAEEALLSVAGLLAEKTRTIWDDLMAHFHETTASSQRPFADSLVLERHATSTPRRREIVEDLREIWCEVMDLDHLDVDDEFLDIGGTSIAAIQIASRVRKLFALEISATLFLADERVTLSTLAEIIKKREDRAS